MLKNSFTTLNALGCLGQNGSPLHFFVSIDRGQVQVQPLPARLTKEDVADILKMSQDGVVKLTKKRLLRVLGHPENNQVRYYSSMDVLQAMRDTNWLSKVTDALYEHWSSRNAKLKKHTSEAASSPKDV